MSDPADDVRHTRRPPRAAVWITCAAVVVTLLLPWSHDDHYQRNAFERTGWAAAIGLAVVAGTVILVAAGRVGGWLRAWTILGALAGAISALAASAQVRDAPAGAAHVRSLGPGLFVIALVLLAVLAGGLRAAVRASVRPPKATIGLAAGALGLALAVAGLIAPWQRLEAPALRALVDSGSTVWTGPELGSTLALRWVLFGTAAVALLAAAWPRTQQTVPPIVLLGGGVAVAVLSLPAATRSTLHGVNATFGAAPGAAVTLAGGLLCAAGGVLAGVGALTRHGRRSALATTAAAALLLTGAPAHVHDARAADNAAAPVRVLDTSGDEIRLGLDARRYGVDYDDDLGGFAARPAVLASTAGTFFLTSFDDETVLAQIVGGRALPVTVLPDNNEASLLAVDARRALVVLRRNSTYSVVSLDVRLGSNLFPLDHKPVTPGRPTVLLSSERSSDSTDEPGHLAARSLDVTAAPDGGMLVVDSIARRAWRVSAATVRSGAVWQPVPVPWAVAPGAGDVAYNITSDNALARVQADGTIRPVAGGASDPRCTLSRDPLSNSFTGRLYRSPFALTADPAGRLWFLLGAGSPANNAVYVLTGGTLRRLPGLDRVSGVQAMPDGSLVITRDPRGPRGADVYRIPSAAAAASSAALLPAVGRGCVSDSRVRLATQHRPVRRLVVASLPRDGSFQPFRVIVDAAGSRVYEGDRTLLLTRDGAAPRMLGRIPDSAYLNDLVADGRGGAWWVLREGTPPRAMLVHYSASGVTREVRTIQPSGSDKTASLIVTADVGTGALLWSWGGRPSLTTPDGTTHASPLTASNLVLRDGRGYATSAPKTLTVARDGSAKTLLGDGPDLLALPTAIATRAPTRAIYGDGVAGVAPNGDLVLHQHGYVARVSPDGRITVLAGPDEGVPTLAFDSIDVVLGSTLIMTDGDTRIWTVDVS